MSEDPLSSFVKKEAQCFVRMDTGLSKSPGQISWRLFVAAFRCHCTWNCCCDRCPEHLNSASETICHAVINALLMFFSLRLFSLRSSFIGRNTDDWLHFFLVISLSSSNLNYFQIWGSQLKPIDPDSWRLLKPANQGRACIFVCNMCQIINKWTVGCTM